jgi:hypothetical protein
MIFNGFPSETSVNTSELGFRRIGGMRQGRMIVFRSDLPVTDRGVTMLLSLFSAFAVGLALIVAIVTIAIPFILGFFDRRDLP